MNTIFTGLSVVVAVANCLLLLAFGLTSELFLNAQNLPHRYFFEAAFLILCVPALGLALGYVLERRGVKQYLAYYKSNGDVPFIKKFSGPWVVGNSYAIDAIIWFTITMFLPSVLFKTIIYLFGWNFSELIFGYLIIATFSIASFLYWENILGKDPYSDL